MHSNFIHDKMKLNSSYIKWSQVTFKVEIRLHLMNSSATHASLKKNQTSFMEQWLQNIISWTSFSLGWSQDFEGWPRDFYLGFMALFIVTSALNLPFIILGYCRVNGWYGIHVLGITILKLPIGHNLGFIWRLYIA